MALQKISVKLPEPIPFPDGKVEAIEIIKEADALAEQRDKEGWKEEDFKQDFLRVQKEISEILKQRVDEKGK